MTTDDLEVRVEELLEEKLGDDADVDRAQLKQEILDELQEQDADERASVMDRLREPMSRRRFLKVLGLGAAGLGLSSVASAQWALWRPDFSGKSDIDADTVDGKEASELGGGSDARRWSKITPIISDTASMTGKNYTGTDYSTVGYTSPDLDFSYTMPISATFYVKGSVATTYNSSDSTTMTTTATAGGTAKIFTANSTLTTLSYTGTTNTVTLTYRGTPSLDITTGDSLKATMHAATLQYNTTEEYEGTLFGSPIYYGTTATATLSMTVTASAPQ